MGKVHCIKRDFARLMRRPQPLPEGGYKLGGGEAMLRVGKRWQDGASYYSPGYGWNGESYKKLVEKLIREYNLPG